MLCQLAQVCFPFVSNSKAHRGDSIGLREIGGRKPSRYKNLWQRNLNRALKRKIASPREFMSEPAEFNFLRCGREIQIGALWRGNNIFQAEGIARGSTLAFRSSEPDFLCALASSRLCVHFFWAEVRRDCGLNSTDRTWRRRNVRGRIIPGRRSVRRRRCT